MASSSSPCPTASPRLCQECRKREFCYQCPRCSFRSCSLACCRAHKERTACTGRRDRTAFVRLSQMSDQTVTSDYHFLEDVLRNVDTGKRILKQTTKSGGGPSSSSDHKRLRPNHPTDAASAAAAPTHALLQASQKTQSVPISTTVAQQQQKPYNPNWTHVSPRWRHVAKHVLERHGTTILFMPLGMQRRLQNQTHVKKDILYWTVEFLIHASPTTSTTTKTSIGDKSTCQPQTVRLTVAETTTLQLALKQQVQPQVPRSVTLDTMELLIKQIPGKTYAILSRTESLREILAHRNVIEFPTIELVPKERLSEFPLQVMITTDDKEQEEVDEATVTGAGEETAHVNTTTA